MKIEIKVDKDWLEESRGIWGLTPLRFSRAVNKAVRLNAQQAMRKFNMAVDSWDTHVEFVLRYKLKPKQGEVEYTISTDNLIYKFVDEGTVEHKIPKIKKKGVLLRFPDSFTPKTEPGSLISMAGESSDRYCYATQVTHPGSEARDFSGIILDESIDELPDEVYEQLEAALYRQRKSEQ